MHECRGGCTGFCRKEPVFDKMRGNRSCTPSECVSRAKKLALFQAVPACAPPVCENTTKIRVQRAATPRRLVVGANKEATMGESSGHGASVAMPLRGASSTFVHGSPAKSNREPLVGIGAVLSIDPNRRGKDGAVFFSDFAKGSPSGTSHVFDRHCSAPVGPARAQATDGSTDDACMHVVEQRKPRGVETCRLVTFWSRCEGARFRRRVCTKSRHSCWARRGQECRSKFGGVRSRFWKLS